MTAFKGLGTYGNAVGVVTPADHKQDNSGLVVKTSGNTVRSGLFWGGTATIVSGKANMSYDVAAYTCATSRGATSGTVFGGNDGTFNVVTTAAPGSNSRYDVVYHWHREYSLDGTDSNPVIGVIQGTAAASPTIPSLSAFPGAIALATILVPAGVTATNTGTTIAQVAPFTAVDGGAVRVRNSTELAAYTPMDGAYALQLDTGLSSKRVAGAWKGWNSDWISFTPTISGLTVGNGTFPTARYKYVDGSLNVECQFVFGSTSAVTASLRVTNPVTVDALNALDNFPLGMAAFLDAGTAAYEGFIVAVSTTQADIRTSQASGTYTQPGGISSTVPFTFGTADSIMWRYSVTPA